MTKQGVRVESQWQVYNDGNHNAFTDLCRYKGDYYLTFRSCPDGHRVVDTSSVLVLKSADYMSWEKVCSFSVPNRDVRDPHFLIFGDRLHVVSGTWLYDPDHPDHRDMNDHEGYGVWSEDGETWNGPYMLEGTHGYYIWRAGAYGDTAYLIGRCLRGFKPVSEGEDKAQKTESWFLKSSDGITWEPAGRMQPEYGDETAFRFEADGSVLAVARKGGNRPAEVWRAKPPYTEWTSKALSRGVGGPLLAKWGDRYLVGGRHIVDQENMFTTLYWLLNDELEEIVELPSGGDNSYPGFVQLSADRALVSYYSSHEGSGSGLPPSAIYLAVLSLV